MGIAIPIERVYLQTGPLEHEYPLGIALRPSKPWDVVAQYGLLIYWPKAYSWLKVQVSIVPPTPSAAETQFAETRAEVEAICRAHEVQIDQVMSAGFVQKHAFRCASVTRTSQLRLRLLIDTSHPAFLTLAKAPRPDQRSELILPLQVVFFDAKAVGAYFSQNSSLDLVLRPAIPVPKFNGVLAIDLGNTSCTIASIRFDDTVYRTDVIQLLAADGLRGELQPQTSPTASELRINRITSFDVLPSGTRVYPTLPSDDLPGSVDFVIGRMATAPGSTSPGSGVILGAKRLLSGKFMTASEKLVTRHRRGEDGVEAIEEVEVYNRAPAELLVTRLLELFRQAALAWPSELAITYPTTYTPREIQNLTEIIERAWLRMQGQPQQLETQPTPTDDVELDQLIMHLRGRLLNPSPDAEEGGLIAQKVDEATAAAFYFLYRRIFESPRGLLRFRYLYPNGMNLLLYDCGGGTTDIALVTAFAPSANHLKLTVRARSGVRGFGGDNLTREVCRLLKAKLQTTLGVALGRAAMKVNVPPKTNDAAATRTNLEDWIKKLRASDSTDELVPTAFDRRRTDSASLQRRENILDLWRWSEQIKMALGESASVQLNKLPGIVMKRSSGSLADAMLRSFSDQQLAGIEQQLGAITLHRWELDALVRPPIERSIRKCNELIRQVLQEDCYPEEQEVHWVVASGNAARYPFIAELLREQLHVPFLQPVGGSEPSAFGEVFHLDRENLKHAVAKGAALALMARRALRSTITIEFDSDLDQRLPFNVGYRDVAGNLAIPLFRVHERYDELKPQPVPLLDAIGEASSKRQTFFLERAFPGDDDFERYIAFDFENGLQGDLVVEYDQTTHEFMVRDAASGQLGELRDLTSDDIRFSPVQRGDI